MHNERAVESSTLGTSPKKQYFWRSVLAGLVVCFAAFAGFGESLWVDELHTSWAISGTWSDLGPRAAAGNQTVWYLSGLKLFTDLCGQSEFTLRLPSAVFVALSVVVLSLWISRQGRIPMPFPALVGLVCCVCLDRTYLFYATEARVYALLSFVQVVGWLAVHSVVRAVDEKNPAQGRWILVWIGAALISVQLHVLSLLPVVVQAGCLGFMAIVNSVYRKQLMVAIGTVLVGIVSSILLVSDVWQKREQWEGFAGDTSPSAVFHLLPWWAYVVPVVSIGAVDYLWSQIGRINRRRRTEQASSQQAGISTGSTHAARLWRRNTLLWGVAATAPCVMAWTVTYWEIAPIFHQRYLLCCLFPLALMALCAVQLLKSSALRWVAVLLVMGCIVGSQGTWRVWQHGYWLGYQRGEGWREAFAWVESELQDRDQVWVESGLIEGKSLQPPLGTEEREYLSYPARGLYPVTSKAEFESVRALVGDPNYWLFQILTNPVADSGDQFIVARCPAGVLQEILGRLQAFARQNDVQFDVRVPPQPYGSISAARIHVERAQDVSRP